jgi:MFS transporter, PAT family, beta-lactamase induction signal transducer AmpG
MTSRSPEPLAKQSVPAALAVYLERRTLVMLELGFSSGLPFLLIFDTLLAGCVMRDSSWK